VSYPATPYLQRMTSENGWAGQIVRDHRGEVDVIVAVRIGPTWMDAVAIESEERTVAMRHRTDDYGLSRLIVPGQPPEAAGAVWFRDGRTVDVLAELLDELDAGR
jgi:hypothetical protein